MKTRLSTSSNALITKNLNDAHALMRYIPELINRIEHKLRHAHDNIQETGYISKKRTPPLATKTRTDFTSEYLRAHRLAGILYLHLEKIADEIQGLTTSSPSKKSR